MINLDTRLIDDLNGNELAVFCHIIKRINKNNQCFPSRELLMEETGFGREKVAKALQSLSEKNVLEYFQKNDNGKFSKTHYKIKTKLASVFINVCGEELEISNRDTAFRSTEIPLAEKSQLSINQSLSINKKNLKAEKIDFNSLLKFINEKTGREFRTINKTVRGKYNARINEGYKKEDVVNAIINASKVQSHRENGCQYLTPEFFSRSSTLDKYGFATSSTKNDNKITDEKEMEIRKQGGHINY